jgi:hypothetical protein
MPDTDLDACSAPPRRRDDGLFGRGAIAVAGAAMPPGVEMACRGHYLGEPWQQTKTAGGCNPAGVIEVQA